MTYHSGQLTMFDDQPDETARADDPHYLGRQLITCIGNKRALLPVIAKAVQTVKTRLGRSRLRILDAFSGSGVVSRLFKAHASYLAANDLEAYAAVLSRCYLRNRSTVDRTTLGRCVEELNARVADAGLPPGFIEQMYAPRDESCITAEDRVFYTRTNARRLDDYRRLIDTVDDDYRDLLLGPLLSKASVHANTAGVFKGFYKNRDTGVGQFGGSGRDALSRIMATITLEAPVLSAFECEWDVLQQDANDVVGTMRGLDLLYVDPPYNQHPYGSNYFMLNLLVRYERPLRVSRVSGIPVDWRRSGYNVREQSLPLLRDLLERADAPFLLVSFNNEGFIVPEQMRTMLDALGEVTVYETPYNAFRGSRSFATRSMYVTEQLYLVERC